MIDITGVDLVEFVKKVYELSDAQGLGILHYEPEPLRDEAASVIVDVYGGLPGIVLDMDYINGRACKMIVWKRDDKLRIRDNWYDHTDRIFVQLLEHFNIEVPEHLKTEDIKKHGCACNCIDCQSSRTTEIVELPKVQQLLQEIKDEDLLEDRREYDCDDLLKAYSLSFSEAAELHALIRVEYENANSVVEDGAE